MPPVQLAESIHGESLMTETNEAFTLTLLVPIDFAGERITELKLREPKVSELDRAQRTAKSNIDTVLNITFLLTGVPVAALGEMRQRDFTRLAGYLEGFTTGGPATGAIA